MKKLKEKRARKIAFVAFGILALIVTILSFINPIAAIGAPLGAFALMVGGVELTTDQEKAYTAMMDSVKSEIEKSGKGYISETKASELINDHVTKYLNDFELDIIKVKGLQDQLDSLGITVNALKETGSKTENKVATGIKKLIADFTSTVKGAQSEKFTEIEVENKTAATTITTSNVSVTAIPYMNAVEVMPGVVPDVKPVQNIMSLVTVQPIGKPSLSWVERVAENGNATWIGEGTIKALQDYTWKTVVEVAKKIASRTKFSEEAIEDLDFMESEINSLQSRDLERTMSTAVLGATKSATSIGGITTMASAFTITALNDTVLRPNLYEVCNALNAQCVALGFAGRKTVVVNPYDWAIAKGEKDSTYRNLDVATRIMSEYNVVEDSEVAVGYILFGELSYFTVKMYKKKGIRLGYSTGDWETNLMSAIAENRLLTMLPDNYKGAIIYDAIGTVKAAIELVEA